MAAALRGAVGGGEAAGGQRKARADLVEPGIGAFDIRHDDADDHVTRADTQQIAACARQ